MFAKILENREKLQTRFCSRKVAKKINPDDFLQIVGRKCLGKGKTVTKHGDVFSTNFVIKIFSGTFRQIFEKLSECLRKVLDKLCDEPLINWVTLSYTMKCRPLRF